MDHFISMYIDDEMSLDEKILFIEKANRDRQYTDEAIMLIKQEKELSLIFNKVPPQADIQFNARVKRFKPVVFSIAASVLLAVTVMFGMNLMEDKKIADNMTISPVETVPYRFVIYQQGSKSVEITGSFIEWQKVPLVPTGADGYWEIVLQVPKGEHQYSFIVDEKKNLPDPSVAFRESDDFGMVNSIITVES